LLLKGISIP